MTKSWLSGAPAEARAGPGRHRLPPKGGDPHSRNDEKDFEEVATAASTAAVTTETTTAAAAAAAAAAAGGATNESQWRPAAPSPPTRRAGKRRGTVRSNGIFPVTSAAILGIAVALLLLLLLLSFCCCLKQRRCSQPTQHGDVAAVTSLPRQNKCLSIRRLRCTDDERELSQMPPHLRFAPPHARTPKDSSFVVFPRGRLVGSGMSVAVAATLRNIALKCAVVAEQHRRTYGSGGAGADRRTITWAEPYP